MPNRSIRLIIIGFIFFFVSFKSLFAAELEKIKVYMLQQDYKAAISEGEKLLGKSSSIDPGLDELYYLLAVAYLKDGNLLRASDIFEIIINELKSKRFKQEAMFGLADTYYLRKDLAQAEKEYLNLLKKYPDGKLKAQIYQRLSEVYFNMDKPEEAKVYLEKLKKDFPSNLEVKSDNNLCVLPEPVTEIYYSVQVGSFSKELNAKRLVNKLNQKGYEAFIFEVNNKLFKVRVGKFKNRSDAKKLSDKLSREGHPVRICP